jgi:hypothetical protein
MLESEHMQRLGGTSCLPNRITASVSYNTQLATDNDNGYQCTYDGTNNKPVSPAHYRRHPVRKPHSISKCVMNSQPYILNTKKLHTRYESKPNAGTRKETPHACTMTVTRACGSAHVSRKLSCLQGEPRRIH